MMIFRDKEVTEHVDRNDHTTPKMTELDQVGVDNKRRLFPILNCT